MSLNKKGSEESLSWPVAAIIAVVILFIMYLVFFTNSGIWGKTKAGADKFFEKTESGIKLYNEYLDCSKNVFSIWKENKGVTRYKLQSMIYKDFRKKYNLQSAFIQASLFQVFLRRKVCNEIEQWMKKNKVKNLDGIRGCAHK
mgnify:CR=1 FL=1